MKLPRFNPFFDEEPPEFDVKQPSGRRGFNWPLLIVVLLAAIWGVVLYAAFHALTSLGCR